MTDTQDDHAAIIAALKAGVELSEAASVEWDRQAPLTYWAGTLSAASVGDFVQLCELQVVMNSILDRPLRDCTLDETRALPFLLQLAEQYLLQFHLLPMGRPEPRVM
jgi:hypothetical protein